MHRWLFAVTLCLFAAAAGRDAFDDWIDATHLPLRLHATSQEVLDRQGRLLRAYQVEGGIWRLATLPGDVDPDFLEMLVAVEDKRFYTHSGIDGFALLRAAGQAVWNRRIVSGGSTLTMQTARLLENSGTGGWAGKIRQIRVALALERRLSKPEILSFYLTHAPYGGNIEGVRAASYAWFGKPPLRLSPEESALLVALPQAPTARRPDRHPDKARAARDRILTMQGHPPARQAPPRQMKPFPTIAPFLSDRARSEGQIVKVTIDRDVQREMERLALRAVEGLPAEMSAALLAVDYQTVEVAAYVGSAQYGDAMRDGFVDMVRAVRSPGSTLKPLIYALAFDQGLAHPETVMPDLPVAFGGYKPQNFDGVFRGDVTVREALMQSLNIPPLLLTDAMGPARLIAALERSGADPRLPTGQPGLAVALGGVGLTLEELVQLYAGLASGGEARALSWYAEQEVGPRIVSRTAAWHVGHILAGIQPEGGMQQGRIAFKTGTSYGHRDAWAIGWDGRHVIGVWLGRPDGTPVPGVFGGDIAAPILFEAFGRLKPELDPLPPPPPETLILPNALLPKPLRSFAARGRSLVESSGVTIAFPPEGARLRLDRDASIVVKLSGGEPPFVVLTDGRPVLSELLDREVELGGLAPGFSAIRVVDVNGRSDDVRISLDD